MAIVGQEPVDRQLSAKVVVFSTRDLFAHACPDLGREIQNRSKTETASLAALVILDTSTASEKVHAGVDVLVEM